MEPIDTDLEIEKAFTNLTRADVPTFTLILGPVASGKTRYRRANYATGAVVLDAGDLCVSLARGPIPDELPEYLLATMEIVGQAIARRAIRERHNLVVEMIGDQQDATLAVIEHMKTLGYKVDVRAMTVAPDESLRHNEQRGPNNFTAYFTQDFHLRWLQNVLSD